MSARPQYNRRELLKSAIAATAACCVARVGAADDSPASAPFAVPLIDTHVYVGRWPQARLPGDELHELIAMLRRQHVTQAWVGSLDGLFHKDVGAVNQCLADFCAQQESELLVPFGIVNPTLPDWEEDVRRCDEQFHMPGVRLHPNYHGYTIDDPRFARLLEVAARRGIIVQLVAWLDNARHKWLTPLAAQVDLKPLAQGIFKLTGLRLVIAGGVFNFDDEAIRKLLSSEQTYCDFAQLADGNSLTTFVDRTASNRIIFGSGAPLHSIESARSTLQNAKLGSEQRNAIASQTAAGLLGAWRNPG